MVKRLPLPRRTRSAAPARVPGSGVAAALVEAHVTLAERVYQLLKRDIVRGGLQPGEPLNEKTLASRYKASRTPLREAIMRLQQEQLLRLVANKGYFVSHLTIRELNELYEFRVKIEGFGAELAAKRWSDEHGLEKLATLARTQYQTTDRASYEHFIESDTSFHTGIARLGHNRLVMRAVADVRCQMERIMFAAINIGYFGELPAREHTEILDAIRARDAALARKLMQEHILSSKDKVLELAPR